ncbi:MAG: carbohydrate ABC transporter permease [Cytophagales bacterium]|nr:carbohydrate ABC transporter permease [Armatimonadota bacterium]
MEPLSLAAGPQVLLHTKKQYTLPIALSQMVGIYTQQYGMLMAGTLVAVLPVIGLFFLLQKEFVAGLTSGAVKGWVTSTSSRPWLQYKSPVQGWSRRGR